MNMTEAEAFWALGLLSREKVPAIAQEALESGSDSPALRILAGLTPAELDEVAPRFEVTLLSLGLGKLSKPEALRICIRAI